MQPGDHLFRRESGRMVAALTRVFGVQNLALAEARLPARLDSSGDLISLLDQDRSQWDQQLVVEGLKFLELSATGTELSQYHVEAAIASVHASAIRTEDTDWETIVSLYDTLVTIRPSPVVAFNRAIAVAQNEGPERGLEEIRAISDRDRLAAYPFCPAALGELELRRGRHESACERFRAALALARNPMEHRFLRRRLGVCKRDGYASLSPDGRVANVSKARRAR
jgi:RNA polymerase sigma-70 factor (ECF subfamily)